MSEIFNALRCCVSEQKCYGCSRYKDCHSLPKNQMISVPKVLILDTINELKKRKIDPVKPQMEHSGSGVTWWNVCGACKTAINPNDKFCHECGVPVDWS